MVSQQFTSGWAAYGVSSRDAPSTVWWDLGVFNELLLTHKEGQWV